MIVMESEGSVGDVRLRPPSPLSSGHFLSSLGAAVPTLQPGLISPTTQTHQPGRSRRPVPSLATRTSASDVGRLPPLEGRKEILQIDAEGKAAQWACQRIRK